MASDSDEKYIAAIDIGTTTLKCFILNSKANTVGSACTQVNKFLYRFQCILYFSF